MSRAESDVFILAASADPHVPPPPEALEQAVGCPFTSPRSLKLHLKVFR